MWLSKSILTLITHTYKIHHQHDHLQYKNITILKIFTIITEEDIKLFVKYPSLKDDIYIELKAQFNKKHKENDQNIMKDREEWFKYGMIANINRYNIIFY